MALHFSVITITLCIKLLFIPKGFGGLSFSETIKNEKYFMQLIRLDGLLFFAQLDDVCDIQLRFDFKLFVAKANLQYFVAD